MDPAVVPSLSLEERLWSLEAERAIRDLVHRYCDAADRRDWTRFKSVFHAGSTHRHGDVFEGTSVEFAALGELMLAQVLESHHQIGNFAVRVTGNSATSQCYFTAHHLMAPDAPTSMFPKHRVGIFEDWWVGGRYFDQLEYRGGKWGIIHRSAAHDWERWETADPRGFSRSLANMPDANL